MPRKRNAKGNGDVTPAKKAKVEAVGLEFRWEYEGDKRTWTQYSSTIDGTLTDAYNNSKKQVEFELSNGIKMCVNFEKNVQKNKKTGWERPVRVAVKDESDSLYYVWQWEDEKGNLNPYGVKNTLELETAHTQMKDSVAIEVCSRSYSVDIQNMEQKNTVTDVIRKVSREQSAAIKADPGAPEPVASSSSWDTPTKVTKGSVGKGKSGGKMKSEPDDSEDTKAAKSGGKTKSGKTKSGAKERPAVKTVVMSGKAPVDAECTSLVGKAHVYFEGKDVYDCMLNQTNVSNNNNKYFIIQLLEANDKKMFYTWFRWGRVGYSGQNNLIPCGPSLEAAKKHFFKKFTDKTKNDWANRHHFVKHPGKYDLLEMDYGTKGLDEIDAPKMKKNKSDAKVPDSKLDKSLQSLVELICDVKSMEEAVMEMQYDAKKAPLGKLTKDQIKAGYSALKKIDACIEKKDFGSALTHACDEFYTRIPHDFGMRPPTKINTKEEVKRKIALIEALSDIEIAIKMLSEGDYSENPVDRHYHSLKCDMVKLDHSSDEFKMVETYLQNTHAKTHNQYKMKIIDIFDVSKHGEKERFNDVGNSNQLQIWLAGMILSQGLRIAPPEAPVTGYMFGKGVYFADMSSKSANYCFATRTKSTGLMLLCDVALGNTNDLLAADYKADKLPAGKHSVKGAGKIAPDPTHVTKTPDGAVVPWGKGKDSGVNNPKGYTLNYNEFIVYDTKQIKMKYLLKIDFKF
ncbi:poly [ADP-ribose] polymerase 2-like [Mercenaria mercenaria]|uniref:poly [ADP-ribose] polymerase 2-like n=1 Tax=Mercenaria mercenaria TaxID=6596 RepID=UPI00234E38B7|nr:poly [ADP-ribose] polymerase 2-like [Mercenaria mercenaria]